MSIIFYIGRHGMTKDDLPQHDTVTGWLEVPINKEGRKNARSEGSFLRGKGITQIICSDLLRTSQTADIISEIVRVPVVKSSKLRSWNMGSMQGMMAKAAKPFLTFFQKNPEIKPPDGEPFVRFYNRMKAVFWAIVAYAKKFPESRILLVTHSQNMDIIPWFIEDIKPGKALEFGTGIAPGGVMEVRISKEGKITTRRVHGS